MELIQIKNKIDKTVKTANNKFSCYLGDSGRAKETKYYIQLETRFYNLCKELKSHPDFKSSGLDESLYDVENFAEFVF